jgi:hypothetical protein
MLKEQKNIKVDIFFHIVLMVFGAKIDFFIKLKECN